MAGYEVPAPTLEQAAGIAQRIYTGLLRELHLGKFAAQLNGAVINQLAAVSPRDMRKTLLDNLGYAAAAARDQVKAEDIRIKPGAGKARIGFCNFSPPMLLLWQDPYAKMGHSSRPEGRHMKIAQAPASSISGAQHEMRLAYYGGAPGMLTSALVWLAAGIVAFSLSPQKAIWTLFIGGMFIHPVAVVWNKAIGRSGNHSAGNPLGTLALASTGWMILMMPLAFGASLLKMEYFFPAMLLIIGGRYLTFATMFGNRLYLIGGAALALAGFVLAKTHASPSLGAFAGAAIEAGFALAIFAATRAEVAAAQPAPVVQENTLTG